MNFRYQKKTAKRSSNSSAKFENSFVSKKKSIVIYDKVQHLKKPVIQIQSDSESDNDKQAKSNNHFIVESTDSSSDEVDQLNKDSKPSISVDYFQMLSESTDIKTDSDTSHKKKNDLIRSYQNFLQRRNSNNTLKQFCNRFNNETDILPSPGEADSLSRAPGQMKVQVIAMTTAEVVYGKIFVTVRVIEDDGDVSVQELTIMQSHKDNQYLEGVRSGTKLIVSGSNLSAGNKLWWDNIDCVEIERDVVDGDQCLVGGKSTSIEDMRSILGLLVKVHCGCMPGQVARSQCLAGQSSSSHRPATSSSMDSQLNSLMKTGSCNSLWLVLDTVRVWYKNSIRWIILAMTNCNDSSSAGGMSHRRCLIFISGDQYRSLECDWWTARRVDVVDSPALVTIELDESSSSAMTSVIRLPDLNTTAEIICEYPVLHSHVTHLINQYHFVMNNHHTNKSQESMTPFSSSMKCDDSSSLSPPQYAVYDARRSSIKVHRVDMQHIYDNSLISSIPFVDSTRIDLIGCLIGLNVEPHHHRLVLVLHKCMSKPAHVGWMATTNQMASSKSLVIGLVVVMTNCVLPADILESASISMEFKGLRIQYGKMLADGLTHIRTGSVSIKCEHVAHNYFSSITEPLEQCSLGDMCKMIDEVVAGGLEGLRCVEKCVLCYSCGHYTECIDCIVQTCVTCGHMMMTHATSTRGAVVRYRVRYYGKCKVTNHQIILTLKDELNQSDNCYQSQQRIYIVTDISPLSLVEL